MEVDLEVVATRGPGAEAQAIERASLHGDIRLEQLDVRSLNVDRDPGGSAGRGHAQLVGDR